MKVKLLLILVFATTIAWGKNRPFSASIFINANGIQFEGDNSAFWHNNNGYIWGGGGLSAGLSINRQIHKKLYLIFELRYIQKGSNYSYIFYNTEVFEVLHLNYVELPFLMGYIRNTKRTDLLLEVGFGYSKAFSLKYKTNMLADRQSYVDTDNFKKYDIPFILNFKCLLNKKGKKNLYLGLRAAYSLLSVHKYYQLRNFDYGIQFDYHFKPSK